MAPAVIKIPPGTLLYHVLTSHVEMLYWILKTFQILALIYSKLTKDRVWTRILTQSNLNLLVLQHSVLCKVISCPHGKPRRRYVVTWGWFSGFDPYAVTQALKMWAQYYGCSSETAVLRRYWMARTKRMVVSSETEKIKKTGRFKALICHFGNTPFCFLAEG